MNLFELNASKELRSALCEKVMQRDSMKKMLDVKEKELEESKQDLQKLETQKPITETKLQVAIRNFIFSKLFCIYY